ncbi:threonine--tRNA ligase [Candidatus Peregrinibacteria bacterium RIFCSPLOWO2_01_FULL_39_12]|nr:MAG: threonine--tRNA ligase [Candidatus Peregrinibacteria bacterium RIFCSPLOWO2_01_FULL_39_12]
MSKAKEIIGLDEMRHSCAHVLAQAVLKMFPEAKLGIGPTIDDGFYYDFDLPRTLIPEDLPILEKKMKEIVKQAQVFVKKEEPSDKAIEFLKEAGQSYKVELVKDLAKQGETITFYENLLPNTNKPMFVDLCRGGHVEHTGKIGYFKLLKIAGAYWKGDEKNPMLQRIYGTCWQTQEELDAYLNRLEEAKKRDHKILGKQLRLFTTTPLVGPGYPLFLPRGAELKRILEEYITAIKRKNGYKFVCIPHVAKEDLYIKSGHMGKYEAMMPVMETSEGERIVMKAMNCPHHFELYNSEAHSYRELPLRYAENTAVYRYEKSGEVNGLFRVRSITQDDTHHFVTHDQIKSEIEMVLRITKEVYSKFGFNKFKARVSIRNPEHPEKYFGSDELWKKAESILIEGVKKLADDYFIKEGEAAFYGPKIDVMIEDAIGREWQLTTIQLDFNQPENFDMTYTGEDGKPHRPAVLHVAILGALERFIGVIIEHYSGAFPYWLAPVQVKIVPVAQDFNEYAKKVYEDLCIANVRVELDDSRDSLGKKIRNSEHEKIPYIFVVGEKEMTDKTVAVRDYATKKQEVMPLKKFMDTHGAVE